MADPRYGGPFFAMAALRYGGPSLWRAVTNFMTTKGELGNISSRCNSFIKTECVHRYVWICSAVCQSVFRHENDWTS